MGHKVNPIGFRLLINKNWKSLWYDDGKNYSDKLISDVEIRKYIKKNYAHCGISKIVIERAADKVNIIIHTSKPGVLIGKKGSDIEKIKASIEKMGQKNVSIKIVEIDKPDSDASIVAQGIAKQLENRIAFKRAVKKAIQNAVRYGVKGIKISCAGRLGGVEIARTEQYKEGAVPLHTLRSNIDYGTATAHTTYGVIGVKVWICKEV